MNRYVLMYADGTFVALDGPSGGYPYAVKDVFHAQRWATAEEAAYYRGIGREFFSIHKITNIEVSDVVEEEVLESKTKFIDP